MGGDEIQLTSMSTEEGHTFIGAKQASTDDITS